MSKSYRYGQAHAPTASDRIRAARRRVADAKREAERMERIGQARETADFARMMRENRSA
jgi:hypothetical protein